MANSRATISSTAIFFSQQSRQYRSSPRGSDTSLAPQSAHFDFATVDFRAIGHNLKPRRREDHDSPPSCLRGLDDTERLPGCKTRKHLGERSGRGTKVAGDDLVEDLAEVGGDGEVAPLEALIFPEPRPAAVDAAALHGASGEKHRVAVAVVRAAIAVLRHR